MIDIEREEWDTLRKQVDSIEQALKGYGNGTGLLKVVNDVCEKQETLEKEHGQRLEKLEGNHKLLIGLMLGAGGVGGVSGALIKVFFG